MHNDSDNKEKSSSPGLLELEDKGIKWDTTFDNYLSAIPRVDGLALSYVIRVLDTPIPNNNLTSFVEETVATAPITDTYFEADCDTVHQLIVSFMVRENSENCI